MLKKERIKFSRDISLGKIDYAITSIKKKEDINTLDKEMKLIVKSILLLTKKFDIDIEKEDIKDKILNCLINSEDETDIAIWEILNWKIYESYFKKIIENLNFKIKILTEELEKKEDYDKRTFLHNHNKLKKEINKIEWGKSLIIIKIINLTDLNHKYWYEIWDRIIIEVANKLFKKINTKLNQLWLNKLDDIYKLNWPKLSIIQKWNEYKKINKIIKEIINEFQIELNQLWIIYIDLKAWINQWEEVSLINGNISLKEAKWSWSIYRFSEEKNKEIKKRSEKNIMYKNKIRQWLKQWKVVPYFQWIRNNKTWKIEKYEALVRYQWEDYELSPYEFIEIIEWTDLMEKTTNAVILETIKEMKWNNYDFSINIRYNDLRNTQFIRFIKKHLVKNNIDPSRLIIEVLEDIGSNDKNFLDSLNELKRIWIKIAIDDFWTWYSSISRVLEINPDFVKLDWSTVRKVSQNNKNWSIINSLTNLFQWLWIKVIAEYVENESIQNELEKIWVDYSQWYLYSKPSKETKSS